MPLLKLLDSKHGSLQHNAAFALYGLADNEVEFIGSLFNISFRVSLSFINHLMVVIFCN